MRPAPCDAEARGVKWTNPDKEKKRPLTCIDIVLTKNLWRRLVRRCQFSFFFLFSSLDVPASECSPRTSPPGWVGCRRRTCSTGHVPERYAVGRRTSYKSAIINGVSRSQVCRASRPETRCQKRFGGGGALGCVKAHGKSARENARRLHAELVTFVCSLGDATQKVATEMCSRSRRSRRLALCPRCMCPATPSEVRSVCREGRQDPL